MRLIQITTATRISFFIWVAMVLISLPLIRIVSASETHIVKMLDARPYYDPVSIEINSGDTIVWKNIGPKKHHRIVTKDYSVFSDDIPVGEEFSFTFNKAGIYPYLCYRHFFMRGKVIVRNTNGTTDSVPEYPYQAAFKEFVVPTLNSGPRMIIASHLDDTIWFTEGGGGFYGFEGIPAQNKLAQIDDSGRIIEYATPTPNGDGSQVGVDSLVMDQFGNVWFTERLTNRIGRLTPNGDIKEFQIPTKDGYALGVDLDSKGNIWFAERYGNRIGWMTPQGKFTEIELPDKDSEPRTVFVDSHDRVWYTARVANEIGYYDIRSKKIRRMQIPTKLARPAGICQTSDGTIYFVEMVGNKIAKIIGNQIIEYPIPTAFTAPFKCAVDVQDNLWVTQVFGNSIAHLDTKTGNITEYKIPTSDSRPGGIAIDRKGRVWFTEQRSNKIGMFDPALAQKLTKQQQKNSQSNASAVGFTANDTLLTTAPIKDFQVPTTGAAPGNDLLEDDEGWLWFTEMLGNKIGAFHMYSQKFREFVLPTSLSMPVGLARDPNGIFWVTQFRGNRLARLDPINGAVDEYIVPTKAALPAGVTVDENGDVWFTQLGANQIAHFNEQHKKFEEFKLPRPESSPLHIVADQQGSLWVTASEERGNYLARFDIRVRRFEVFDLPTPNASPIGMLVDGSVIWVAEGGSGKLARFDTQSQSWEEFAIPAEKSEPVKLAKDWAGRIWLTDGGGFGGIGGNRLAVFEPNRKKFTLIPMKTQRAKPRGIIAASDGNTWFTQQGANRISRLSLEEAKNGDF